jgi:TATA-binding protein-associated factor
MIVCFQIKYLLAVRFDLTAVLLHDIYPAILAGLGDDADDVVGVSASSLLSVVHGLVDNAEIDVEELTGRLWDALKELDDLTSSTHSIMQLLSEILKQQRCPTSSSCSSQSLTERIPRLFLFLSHSSSLVRRAALSTLDTLTGKLDLAQLFLPYVVKPLTSHLFQVMK